MRLVGWDEFVKLPTGAVFSLKIHWRNTND